MIMDDATQADLLACYSVYPDPVDPLGREVEGGVETGARITARIVPEKKTRMPYLNAREIITMMTIGDYPASLGIGYRKGAAIDE
jgi:FdhD protein